MVGAAADRSSTPHAMQWAIRANTQSRPAAPQTTGGSGFIYVDSSSMRRGAGSNAAAAAAAAAGGTAGTSELPGANVSHSMRSSASALARAFGIVVREVSWLLLKPHTLLQRFVKYKYIGELITALTLWVFVLEI